MRYFVILLFGLMFVSCSSKPNMLVIEPFSFKSGTYTSKSKIIRKVYIKHILDLRQNPFAVGSFVKDGDKYLVETKTNLRLWLYNALEKALNDGGYEVIDKLEKDAVKVKIQFQNISADYKKGSMLGFVNVLVAIDKGFSRNKENLRTIQKANYSSIPSKEEYENFVKIMMDNIAKDILKQIM